MSAKITIDETYNGPSEMAAAGTNVMSKVIEVDKQVRLSLFKTAELVLNGIQFRLFRAMVTVAIIALAVAFLTTMLGESVIARSVSSAINEETAPRRLYTTWVASLTQPLQPEKLTQQLAMLDQAPQGRRDEFMAWGGYDAQQLQDMQDYAKTQRVYDRYFEDISEGDRRMLVGRATGEGIYETLQDADAKANFRQELAEANAQMPGSNEEFDVFLDAWKDQRLRRDPILVAQAQAVANVAPLLQGMTATEFLTTAEPDLVETLEPFGYRMSAEEFDIICEQARLTSSAEQIANLLKAPLVKVALSSRVKADSAANVTSQMLFEELSSGDGTDWLLGKADDPSDQGELGKIRQDVARLADPVAVANMPAVERSRLSQTQPLVADFDMDPEWVQAVCQWKLRAAELSAIEDKVARSADTAAEGQTVSPRMLALLSVSFLVCMVGIVNAMLMSVAERFREIATMKCLGATDGFIMMNFMLESAVQGIAGGIVGAILGMGLAVLRSGWSYGSMALDHIPVALLIGSALLSLVLGVILSVLAAVYPAFVAARLAPMEAMRIE